MDIDEVSSAYTAVQLGDILGRSPRQVRRLLESGQLEYFRIGRERRVTQRALTDYLERTRVRPTRAQPTRVEPTAAKRAAS